ncbi:MAG: NAD(+) synthase [Planctomycetota bacterium]
MTDPSTGVKKSSCQTRQRHGFYRVAAVAPPVHVANPSANVAAAMVAIEQLNAPDLIVLPELALTGYTCGDLLLTKPLLQAAERALMELAARTEAINAVVIVGLPLGVETTVMNVAAVLSGGRLCGVVPKTFLPNYREFYEQRHFAAASSSDPSEVCIGEHCVPFGTDLLFVDRDAVIAVEICEDLWTPIPPSCHAAMAGANVIANLSASNELIGKADWRRELVRSQSGRLIAAYAYASAGPGESTSDLVFGGHNVVAENGVVLNQSRRIGDGRGCIELDADGQQVTLVTCDVDLQKLAHDRRVVGSFDDGRGRNERSFRKVCLDRSHDASGVSSLLRDVDAHPFVPDNPASRQARCAEILEIQTAGLVKRLTLLDPSTPLTIGISGGLDSTLALIVALRAIDQLKRERTQIHAYVMPGFGTSEHTRQSADGLVAATGVTSRMIDIRRLCLDAFDALDHRPMGIDVDADTDLPTLQSKLESIDASVRDLVFENVQARMRTMLLMNGGFVLGTGDLSEQALGWSTYNADHMSMYNVNTSIPKTLVRYLVRFAADHLFEGRLQSLLHRIADTPISPELLPLSQDGSIRQHTEAALGPFEMHDFFLYHFVRGGCDAAKLQFLAEHAEFDVAYSSDEIAATLKIFMTRFFANQFKRNCVPDGPKVGSVSLSPRGDWRMPSDGDVEAFLPGNE